MAFERGGIIRRDDESDIDTEKSSGRIGRNFKDLDAENTASLGLKKSAGQISSSIAKFLDPNDDWDATCDVFQFITAKLYENREAIGKATVTASRALPKTGGTMTGAVNFNSQNMTNVDIDSGTIDGTNVTVGSGKTLNVSAGTLTLAANQISGDKVEGGTIASITISDLALGTITSNCALGEEVVLDARLGSIATSGTTNKSIIQGAASNLDIGAYELRAATFESDVATGTAPFTVASTTRVVNLQASTVGTIAGLAPNTATTQATQPNITSVGTLSALTVSGDTTFGDASTDKHFIKGNITASGDISGSGVITGNAGANAGYTVRPNLYFFATNTSATTMNGGSDFAGGVDGNEGSLPATNTTAVALSQEQNSHSSVFSLSSNRVTIARAGLYKITYNATLELNNGSNRAEGFTGIVQETSGGTVSLVDGSEGRGYHRFVNSTPPSAQTYAASVIVNVAADSIYDLRFGLTAHAIATQKLRTIPTGTSFIIEAIT